MKMIALGLLLVLMISPLLAERVDKVYSFGSADPQEVESVLRQVLSKEGKMVLLKDQAKVLVQDEAAVHETVALLLADLSKPRPNIKVEVTFNEDTTQTDRGAGVGLRRNSLEVNLTNRQTSTSRSSGQFLVVQSGGSASLRVVQEVPFIDYFYTYAWGHGYLSTQTHWRDIGSQLSVRPRVRGELIEVELMPQITALVDGKREIIDYRDLVTTVTLANGQEVSLGGFQGAGDEFNRNFFIGGNQSRSTQSTGFKIRASLFQY
jgi:type II secretory pathway component GspD/PulD (secretin)